MPQSSHLETLYREHHPWLSSWLQKRLGCPTHAADLAQDTFVKLLHKPQQLNTFNDARAFLTTVAKGLCIDHWRRRQIEQAWLDANAYTEHEPLHESEQRAIVDSLIMLDKWLSELPPLVVKAFIGSQVQGYTYCELAEQLGVSERTIKRYIAQALCHCATLLDD